MFHAVNRPDDHGTSYSILCTGRPAWTNVASSGCSAAVTVLDSCPCSRSPRARHRVTEALPMNRTYLAVIAVVLGATASPALAHDANHPPTANFTWSPVTPRTGDAIAFAATTSDPDHDPVLVRWDLDGNGSFETTGASVTRTLARGAHTVALQAIDLRGASVVVRRTVTVANAAPSASFDWSADGNDVTLRAAASDPENDALNYRWAT